MKVFCILSDDRAFRSKSPAMHTAVLQRYGIEGIYVPFRVEADLVGDAVRGLRALGIHGANVTVPYKEAVMPFLDSLSDEADRIGAVNTIVREGSRLIGHNTDARGFADALEAVGFSTEGKPVMVFGTGGAAKAVVYAVSQAGAGSITVVGRNAHRAAQVAERFGCRGMGLDTLPRSGEAAALVVNATAVSSPRESPEMARLVRGLELVVCRLVVDLNYGRTENFWTELAISHGASFIDGIPMLAYQARRSFELWTGIAADAGDFLKNLR